MKLTQLNKKQKNAQSCLNICFTMFVENNPDNNSEQTPVSLDDFYPNPYKHVKKENLSIHDQ